MLKLKELAIRFRWTLVIPFATGAFLSLFAAVRGALSSSEDFPWAASSLLRMKIDPWHAALAKHGSEIAHFTAPNFLHAFYIVLMPLSLLSFHHAAAVWCCINILFSIGSILLLKHLFGLSRFSALSVLLLLWMSTPFRSTIEKGQMDMLELFLLCVVFTAKNSTLRGLALGFSVSQISFAPVVVSFLWFKRNIRTLAVAALVPAVALFMAWGLLGVSLSVLAAEPFAVSLRSASPGMADFVTCIQSGLRYLLPAFTAGKALAYGLGLIASGAIGFYISRRQISQGAQFTLVAVASLFTTSHPQQAYILLVVPLSYAVSHFGKSIRHVALPIIAVFWFMTELFLRLQPNSIPVGSQWLTLASASCALGTLLVFLTWAIPRIERDRHAHRAHSEDKASESAITFSAA